ncbi:type II secretion system minor pseudopilin GspK [Chromobacterium subtsugae]|uniref:Type II secretion system protein K n=1 Tax=Chromobacterium subtsugae TaxID=251747 RepID=A0ABS7FGG5_9NEIS|nr:MULTISPECIES: type II secretion system minor pseudopilin GspK [Chromobacterium]MBW7567949.1 type II secretion system minor pseudopilin GspK [Chromobacterium subtsugae]MBW8289176.1 type II secretion system minor pseudopilin GspK [Chromobacterium subtsugae]WSE92659.1 type II secretion system minor pseudopilin GspK [Chromobacterium subtsugae]WVH61037.1 type II secretion system minor pseudopilin GspK [Chromobacterium subtsugae]
MRRRQSGMAVIMALLIVALATTAASLVLWQQGLWWHQLENDKSRAQLRLVADAGLGWAMEILRFNSGPAGNGVVALSQLWAQPLPQTEAQGVKVSGSLSDLQGRFNLNSLVANGQTNTRQVVFYKRLLVTLGLPSKLSEPLLKSLRGGREDDGRQPAADSGNAAAPQPNHPLLRVEMLRWLPGYTPEVMEKLAPHVAALPPGVSQINVNTATDMVMKTLLPGIGDGNLLVLLNQRKSNYFKDAADFKARLPGAVAVADTDYGAASSYFQLDSRSSFGKARLQMRAMIYSSPNAVKLLWRQDGNDGRSQSARPGGEKHDDAATLSAGGLAR